MLSGLGLWLLNFLHNTRNDCEPNPAQVTSPLHRYEQPRQTLVTHDLLLGLLLSEAEKSTEPCGGCFCIGMVNIL